jgi:methionyl-tRNA formyltransferase
MSSAQVLFLGPSDSEILTYLREHHDDVWHSCAHPSQLDEADTQREFLVSHGYRHILPAVFLDAFQGSAVNCHISYLPWNRGADPNLWSWLDGTPRGVTIHRLAAGIDTGDMIARRSVDFSATFDEETLATSYRRLQAELLDVFADTWPSFVAGRCTGVRQEAGGSYHRSRDKALFAHLLDRGWDTPVAKLVYPVSRFPRLDQRNVRLRASARKSA